MRKVSCVVFLQAVAKINVCEKFLSSSQIVAKLLIKGVKKDERMQWRMKDKLQGFNNQVAARRSVHQCGGVRAPGERSSFRESCRLLITSLGDLFQKYG